MQSNSKQNVTIPLALQESNCIWFTFKGAVTHKVDSDLRVKIDRVRRVRFDSDLRVEVDRVRRVKVDREQS